MTESKQQPTKPGNMMSASFAKNDCLHFKPLLTSLGSLQIDVTQKCKDCSNVGENCHSYIKSPLLEGILHATKTSKCESNHSIPKFKAKSPKSVQRRTEKSKSHPPKPFFKSSSLPKDVLISRMRAVLYGNCIGDAIGLLTEFMTKEDACEIYMSKQGMKSKDSLKDLQLEYEMKYNNMHRHRFQIGDWTDDSDQMILILRTLLDCRGKADEIDYVHKFRVWVRTGYKELGDKTGLGIGRTTRMVVKHPSFLKDPHKSAFDVWDKSGKFLAPNGGVMRTSILGIQDFSNMETVIDNTRNICKVTHADPRCIASCVAVTTAIALMLQGKHCKGSDFLYDEKEICNQAYEYACRELETSEQREELKDHMFASSLAELKLDDINTRGYTYKCLGAGFWAFRQSDFRRAITELVMEAGDGDTNGAVAGALLGCKLGVEKLPDSWLSGLLHKQWLDDQIDRYFAMIGIL